MARCFSVRVSSKASEERSGECGREDFASQGRDRSKVGDWGRRPSGGERQSFANTFRTGRVRMVKIIPIFEDLRVLMTMDGGHRNTA